MIPIGIIKLSRLVSLVASTIVDGIRQNAI